MTPLAREMGVEVTLPGSSSRIWGVLCYILFFLGCQRLAVSQVVLYLQPGSWWEDGGGAE